MAQEVWMLQTKRADFEEIGRNFGIDPVLARVIRNRDVVSLDEVEAYLNGGLDSLHSPYLLKDLGKSVAILKEKIKETRPIRVVGDYDIDGVCATYILYCGLLKVGAVVDYEIPDRIKDGYGINETIIEAAAQSGIDTLITCDNGISAVTQIQRGKELGLTVLVTDHHDIIEIDGEDVLPPADGIINPKQKDCMYPYKEICGALVAFKLIEALYETFFIDREELLTLLEFAAIATVGDVMKLQKENRVVVREGLRRIANTSCLGLRKLIEKNNLDIQQLSAYHIGFVIGPCLNAGGRLQSAKLALSLLLCHEEEKADEMATQLKELNDLRKQMTMEGLDRAIDQVESYYLDDKVLVVYLENCHESLAGIIAGRLREHYQKPAIVLTEAEEGVKGSGRSIETYHMFEALVEVKDLLVKFGGHPMAAGLSLRACDMDTLRTRMNENAKLTEEDFTKKVWIDVAMPIAYINEKLITQLERLEPFGQGNDKPQFAQKDLYIRSVRVLGKNKNVVKLSLSTQDGTVMDGMLFENGDLFMERIGSNRVLDVVYYPAVNDYNGNRTLQIMIRHYKVKKG